ncbi:hypothetical protein Lser_V15G02224 [Lactuca serriola]
MLPKLIGLYNTANVIELPKLVELKLDGLPNFTTIYPENTSLQHLLCPVTCLPINHS